MSSFGIARGLAPYPAAAVAVDLSFASRFGRMASYVYVATLKLHCQVTAILERFGHSFILVRRNGLLGSCAYAYSFYGSPPGGARYGPYFWEGFFIPVRMNGLLGSCCPVYNFFIRSPLGGAWSEPHLREEFVIPVQMNGLLWSRGHV